MKKTPYSLLVIGLLTLATAPSALVAWISPDQKDEPRVTAVTVCKVVNPPPSDAKPNTTTLDCGKQFAWEIPDWYATIIGDEIRVDTLEDGKHRLSKEQPAGSEVRYSPPCPKQDRTLGYQRPPLQKAPCNPELKPQE